MEALLELPLLDDKSFLDIKCAWAPTMPEPTGHVPREVRFKGEYRPVLEQVARELRPDRAPEKGVFIGKVEGLKRRDDAPQQVGGEITLLLLAEDESLRARVELRPADYLQACDAHKLRNYVRITGELARGGRISRFVAYDKFEILRD
jgi:hypothetical protein